MAARRRVYKPVDRKVFRRTARVKKANVPGHTLPRGGQCL